MPKTVRLGSVVVIVMGLVACDASDLMGPRSSQTNSATGPASDATLEAKVVQGPRPVRGVFVGSDAYGALCGEGAGITVTSTGLGTLSHLGRTEMVQIMCFDPISYAVIGTSTWTMTAANGDQIEGVMTGFTFTAYGFDLYLEITGGTGRFAEASGELTAYVYSDGSGVWTSPTDGWISY